jgi:hypothetical protein
MSLVEHPHPSHHRSFIQNSHVDLRLTGGHQLGQFSGCITVLCSVICVAMAVEMLSHIKQKKLSGSLYASLLASLIGIAAGSLTYGLSFPSFPWSSVDRLNGKAGMLIRYE